MSRLALYLLGSPRIELDGEPIHNYGLMAMIIATAACAVQFRRGLCSDCPI
jgi:hypothetical protein